MVGTVEKAKAESEVRGRELAVKVGGVWRLGEDTPAWDAVVGEHTPERVRIDDDGLRVWDSSLLLFLLRARRWSDEKRIPLDDSALPAHLRKLLSRIGSEGAGSRAQKQPRASLIGTLDRWGRRLGRESAAAIGFV